MLWRANCAISVSTISDMSLHHCWPEYFCMARFTLYVILDNTLSQICEKHPRGGGLGTYVGATRPALAPPSIRYTGAAVPGHRSCGQTRPTPPTPPTRSTLRHSTLRHTQTRPTRLPVQPPSDTGQTQARHLRHRRHQCQSTPLRHCFDTPRHYSGTSDTSDTQTHQGSTGDIAENTRSAPASSHGEGGGHYEVLFASK